MLMSGSLFCLTARYCSEYSNSWLSLYISFHMYTSRWNIKVSMDFPLLEFARIRVPLYGTIYVMAHKSWMENPLSVMISWSSNWNIIQNISFFLLFQYLRWNQDKFHWRLSPYHEVIYLLAPTLYQDHITLCCDPVNCCDKKSFHVTYFQPSTIFINRKCCLI